jgi:hypothetical protein
LTPASYLAKAERALNQVERIRLLADYTGEEIDPAKAAWVLEQAGAFVEAIRNDLIGKTPSAGGTMDR